MDINYSLIMDREIKKLDESGKVPTLLLHSCCAPCSTSVLETLCNHFKVTVFYYNPNIYPGEEFYKRCKEQENFCENFDSVYKPEFICTGYDEDDFKKCARGHENEPEKGRRCLECYRLRLEKTAKYASEHGFEFFTTTLSVSPMKSAYLLNTIGGELGEKYNVKYLFSDFKKKDGYKRSCVLSDIYRIYRQEYCGCIYSMAERYLSKAKALIFDVDGTLLDTMWFYEDFASEVAKAYGIEPDGEMREAARGLTVKEACAAMKSKYGISESVEEILNQADSIIEPLYAERACMKDGVREFLDFCVQKGYRMCIATATKKVFIAKALKRLGIYDMFEFILTCPEVGASKYESLVYDKSCDRLGVKKEDVIIFEDALFAMKTAKNAGYFVIGVHENTEKNKTEEIKKACDIYVRTMDELIHREKLEY